MGSMEQYLVIIEVSSETSKELKKGLLELHARLSEAGPHTAEQVRIRYAPGASDPCGKPPFLGSIVFEVEADAQDQVIRRGVEMIESFIEGMDFDPKPLRVGHAHSAVTALASSHGGTFCYEDHLVM